jgi:hypothetical protein
LDLRWVPGAAKRELDSRRKPARSEMPIPLLEALMNEPRNILGDEKSSAA